MLRKPATTGIRAARARLTVVCTVCAVVLGLGAHLAAKGENVVPAYEGWYENADGTFELLFGYFNRNLAETLDVPIGPGNAVEPGGPDRGQPTHFDPLRSRYVFSVRVPKDFGAQEVVWTLTSNGKTERAYGSLRPDYIIDKGVIQANNGAMIGAYGENVAPQLRVDGDAMRQAKVGVPITLTAIVTDDDVPKPLKMNPAGVGVVQVPTAAMGLRFSWRVYRGVGAAVSIDPPQFDAWEDYREGRNSPHSPGWVTPPVPPDKRWVVRATFSEPGTYVIRALAHDGALSTARDVTVNVTR